MATTRTRIKATLFALVAIGVTGAATWLAWDLTHEALGTFGGVLAGLAAAMLVGAPFLVVGVMFWGPQYERAPLPRPTARDRERTRT